MAHKSVGASGWVLAGLMMLATVSVATVDAARDSEQLSTVPEMQGPVYWSDFGEILKSGSSDSLTTENQKDWELTEEEA